jgi:hypothetical protein
MRPEPEVQSGDGMSRRGIMAMGQVTARISDELEAALNRWAADEGQQRADLIRNILTEAADARRERRAMFDRPALPTPADLQHLTVEVRNLLVELNRVLRQNGKRDAELAQSAKVDAIGVSEARTAIIAQLTAEMGRLTDLLLARIAELLAGQVAALTASPVMTDIAAALKRIEEHPGLKEMRILQEAHTIALRTLNATIKQSINEPRTIVRFLVWDRDWSPRKVLAGLALVWLICVGSYHGLARMLPVSWLAVRSSDLQTGTDGQATCALLKYRFSTTDCDTRFDGGTMQVTVVRDLPGKAQR